MMGVRARGPGGIYGKDGAASTRKQRQLRERAEVRQAPPAPRPWATFVRPVARQPSQSDRPPTAAARHLAARQSHPSTSRCLDLALALEPTRLASCVLRPLPSALRAAGRAAFASRGPLFWGLNLQCHTPLFILPEVPYPDPDPSRKLCTRRMLRER